MIIFYTKTERLTRIAARVERFKGRDIQIIYCKWLLGMMYYLELMIFDRVSFLDDVICVRVYIDRYPVTVRYFEGIFTDVIPVSMRYDDAIYTGRVEPDAVEFFFNILREDACAIDQNTGSCRPDGGAIASGTAPKHTYF